MIFHHVLLQIIENRREGLNPFDVRLVPGGNSEL